MTSDRPIDDLIQLALDGVLDAAQRTDLADRLARDPAAAERYEELKRVAAGLRGLPEADVPAGLRTSILARVRADAARGRRARAAAVAARAPTFWRRAGTWMQALVTEGPVMKTWKTAAVAGAAVVVAAGLIYIGSHFPPGDTDGAVGSIGAVKKYSAPQITDQDVVLGTDAAEDVVPFSDVLSEAAWTAGSSREFAAFAAKAPSYDAKQAAAELEALGRALEARGQALDAKLQMQAELLAKELQAACALEAKKLDAKTLEASSALEAKKLDAKTLEASSALEAKKLDAKTLEALTLEARSLAEGLAAKKIHPLEAREPLGRMVRTLDAAGALDAKRLESAAADLEAASRLAASSSLDAAAALGRASRSYVDARNQFVEAKTLEARRQYLDAAAAHAGELAGARQQLNAMRGDLAAAATLDAKRLEATSALAAKLQASANDLAAKGLLGARRQLEAKTLDAKSLLAAKNAVDLGAKALQAGRRLDAASELGRMSATLDAKLLAARNSLGAAASGDLAASTALLGAKDMLNASTLDAMNQHLEGISRLGRSVQLEAKVLDNMRNELGRAAQLGAKIQD